MKLKVLIYFIAAYSAAAQPAGTIIKVSVNTITAVAGVVNCTFTNQVPALPSGVSMTCHAGTDTMTQTAVIPVGNASGVAGSFASSADNVTWVLTQPTAGTINWQIAANGASQSGTM
jgi:hypothetical protein